MLSSISQPVLSTTIFRVVARKIVSSIKNFIHYLLIRYIHIIESLGISGIITIT